MTKTEQEYEVKIRRLKSYNNQLEQELGKIEASAAYWKRMVIMNIGFLIFIIVHFSRLG